MSKVTQDQLKRGYKAQSRFFQVMSGFKCEHRPSWFIRVEEASALLDSRGIDGFAYVRRFLIFKRRIPLQLKTLLAHDKELIEASGAVYLVIHLEMEEAIMMRKLITRLETARTINFEPHISEAENRPMTSSEKNFVKEIERCRELYRWRKGVD